MTNHAGSLARLHDIIVPEAVPFWPPAPGWWLLAGLLLVMAGGAVFRTRRRYQANRYRREALAELSSAVSADQVATLLKRVALTAWPRTDVAALHGEAWMDWLERQGGERPAPVVAQQLTRDVYRASPSTDIGELKAFAAVWIRQHRQERER